MMALITYQDFLERVDQLGFMPLSCMVPGLPSLSEETLPESWHTGECDTDPWCWKDRAAEEKRLAYGCIVGGRKGFVSARTYPLFYAAYHPVESMEERWASGRVSRTTWQLWQLFEGENPLDTSDVRRAMGVTAKKGGSRVDASIQELQRDYYITVAGNRRKVSKHGQPYGWPACIYERVIDWSPENWMSGTPSTESEEARERILDIGMAVGGDLSRKALAQALWGASAGV